MCKEHVYSLTETRSCHRLKNRMSLRKVTHVSKMCVTQMQLSTLDFQDGAEICSVALLFVLGIVTLGEKKGKTKRVHVKWPKITRPRPDIRKAMSVQFKITHMLSKSA